MAQDLLRLRFSTRLFRLGAAGMISAKLSFPASGTSWALSPAQADGADPVVKDTTWDSTAGIATVPARTVAVLIRPSPS